jgi:preprotein translocase SecE subunit
MARSTRQQRRQRRAQAAGTPPLRPAPRPRPTTEEEPPKQPVESRPEQRSDDVRSGIPGVRFLQESWAELKKVEWPNQHQLISGTAVVLVACLVTGVYLYANDRLWEYVVHHLLLR